MSDLYRESVSGEACYQATSKSPNKLNRIYVTAEPLANGLAEFIEEGKLPWGSDRARILIDDFGWDAEDASRIWEVGPRGYRGPNILVDKTKDIKNSASVKYYIIRAFEDVTNEGVLAEERLRGIRFSITDILLADDARKYGMEQIFPAARRALYAAMLLSRSVLYESVDQVTITVPVDAVRSIYQVIKRRRGQFTEKPDNDSPEAVITATMPTSEVDGFVADLESEIGSKAICKSVFDHWQPMHGDPTDPNTSSGQTVTKIRKRKELKEGVPGVQEFHDNL